VLLRVPNAPKLSPQFEDKDLFIMRVVGNHVYALENSSGNEVKVLYRRDRLKPVPGQYKWSTPTNSGRVAPGGGVSGS
jgi:hypothetical protein